MLQVTESILYSNHHSTVGNFSEVYYLIKLFANKFVFRKYLRKSNTKFLLLDFLTNGTALLARKVVLANYITSLQNNWGNTKSSYNKGNKNNHMVKDNNNTIKTPKKDLKNNKNDDN